MRITDYETVESIVKQNLFLLDGPDGTKNIYANVLAKELYKQLNANDIFSNFTLKELQQVNRLSREGDKLLIGTPDKNVAISVSEGFFQLLDAGRKYYANRIRSDSGIVLDNFEGIKQNNAPYCRTIFRGKNLGSSVTAEQKDAIRYGEFHDMFIGDYWEMGGNIWRIWDFDYFYAKMDGDQRFVHHILISPDFGYFNNNNPNSGNVWNSTNDVSGGIKTATIYTSVAQQFLNKIASVFGSNKLLTFRIIQPTSANSTTVTSTSWETRQVFIPNSLSIFGYDVTRTDINVKTPSIQMALPSLEPNFIFLSASILNDGTVNARRGWWLSDISNNSTVYGVSGNGLIGKYEPSHNLAYKFFFGLTAGPLEEVG